MTDNNVIPTTPIALNVPWYGIPGTLFDDTLFALVPNCIPISKGWLWSCLGDWRSNRQPSDACSNVRNEAARLLATLCHRFSPSEWDRHRMHGVHQTDASLSPREAHVYSLRLSDMQVTALLKLESDGTFQGISATEYTPRLRSFKQIRNERLVDWTTLGILYSVLMDLRLL